VEYFDSLRNLLSGFGGPRDRTTQNVVEQPAVLSSPELEILYRNNHYSARIVELLPDESTRRGFTTTAMSDAGSSPFQGDFQRLGLMPKLNQADKWARLYGGAAVILGIDDGRDPSEPVDMDNIRCLEFAYVIDRWSVVSGPLEGDPSSPNFGYPQTYEVQYAAYSLENDSQSIVGMKVHSSRMLRFEGVTLPPSLRSDQDYWGDSVLQRVFESMCNLGMIEKAMGNIVQTFNQAVFRMRGLRQLAKAKNGSAELITRFEAANIGQSMLNVFLLDAEGESYEKQSTNVAGLDGLYDRVAQSFGSAAGMPLTLLFGTPPAGLSTDDSAGARNWLNTVRAHQELAYIPNIQYVAEILAKSKDGPKVSGDILVVANPLQEPTEEERAKTMRTMAEFAAILIDRGVLSPTEVRTSFFASAGFTTDIIINESKQTSLIQPQDEAELIFDQNSDPKNVRAARRRIQTLIESGKLDPPEKRKCAGYPGYKCKSKASQYDHTSDYDEPEKVVPVCASCHNVRTNMREKGDL